MKPVVTTVIGIYRLAGFGFFCDNTSTLLFPRRGRRRDLRGRVGNDKPDVATMMIDGVEGGKQPIRVCRQMSRETTGENGGLGYIIIIYVFGP